MTSPGKPSADFWLTVAQVVFEVEFPRVFRSGQTGGVGFVVRYLILWTKPGKFGGVVENLVRR
jgi:hypothetical protein